MYLFISEINIFRRIVICIKWENVSEKHLESKKNLKHIQDAIVMGKVNKGPKGKMY